MKKLFIDGKRTAYVPEQCGDTLTVGQLISALQAAVEWGDLSADSPIYLSNDRGYTFGEIDIDVMIGEDYESAEDYRLEVNT